MNTIAIGRIAWKEFRSQILLLVLLIVAAISLQIIPQLLITINPADSMSLAAQYGLFYAFAALFAAACGAMMYSSETENGTRKILETLPLKSSQLMLGKLLGSGALVAIFLFTILLTLVIMFQTGWVSVDVLAYHNGVVQAAEYWELFFAFTLTTIEFFCWGWFCSLIFQRTLLAIFAAFFVAVVSTGIMMSIRFGDAFELYRHLMIWPYRVATLVGLTAVNLWLSSRWLGTGSSAGEHSVRQTIVTRLTGRSLSEYSKGNFLRLVWHAAKPSRFILCGMLALTFAALLAYPMATFQIEFAPYAALGSIIVGILIALVAGLSSFSGDQSQNKFKFFVEQGEHPGAIWFSRVLVWLIAIAVCCGTITFAFQTLSGLMAFADTKITSWVIAHWVVTAGITFFLCCLIAFAVGNWCSLNIRSSLLSACAAVSICAPLLVWTLLMFAGQLPLWWSVFPIPVCFLISSFLRSKHWLLQRNSIGSWLIPLLVIVVPFGLIFYGMTWYRANEVPVFETGLLIASADDTRFTQELQDEFQQAFRLYLPHTVPARPTADEAIAWHFLEKMEQEQVTQLSDEQWTETRTFVADNQSLLETIDALIEKIESPEAIAQISRTDIPVFSLPKTDAANRAETDRHYQGYFGIRKVAYWRAQLALQEADPEQALAAILSYSRLLRLFEIDGSGSVYDAGWPMIDYGMLEAWLNLDSQTPELLKNAFQQLEDFAENSPFLVRSVQMALREVYHDIDANRYPERLSDIPVILNWLPWEKERNRRVANAMAKDILDHDNAVLIRDEFRRGRGSSEFDIHTIMKWHMTSAPTETNRFRHALILYSDDGHFETNTYAELVYRRHHFTMIFDAITALKHKLETGEYPENLMDEKFLSERVVRNPNNDFDIKFYPAGLKTSVLNYDIESAEYSVAVAANRPFFVGNAIRLHAAELENIPPDAVVSKKQTTRFSAPRLNKRVNNESRTVDYATYYSGDYNSFIRMPK